MTKRVIKRSILFLSILVLLALGSMYFHFRKQHDACWQRVVRKVERVENLEAVLGSEISRFQQFIEESLVARAQILSVVENLREKRGKPLSGRDLEVLRSGTAAYLVLRERLYNIAERYECAIDVGRLYLRQHGISPLLHRKAVLLSLGAALTLNDNWVLAVALFQSEPRLRRLLNDPDSGFGIDANSLTVMSLAANSLEIRERVRRAIRFYEKKPKEAFEDDDQYRYLNFLIEQSPSYNMLRERRAGTFLVRQLDSVGLMSTDFVHELGKDGMDLLSKFFGNTVGLFESRKGKLYGKKKVHDQVISTLKPLDILLEKTPFRLTDTFIPGHFGHVAIWLGTETELRALGLWNHPVVKPHHEQLRSDSKLIVEALRGGVQLSSLEEFLNVDDLAVLRPTAVTEHSDEERRAVLTKEALLLAFRQLGKDYDFNFNVDTTEKIVCSELVYVSFPSIEWPTEKVMARHTISPDNVADLALGETPLKLITLYHDGALIPEEGQLELFRKLIVTP